CFFLRATVWPGAAFGAATPDAIPAIGETRPLERRGGPHMKHQPRPNAAAGSSALVRSWHPWNDPGVGRCRAAHGGEQILHIIPSGLPCPVMSNEAQVVLVLINVEALNRLACRIEIDQRIPVDP